MFDFSATGDTA